MNIKRWLRRIICELSRLSGQMEAKLEQHAGLLLWTFSPITASGLALHQPVLSGQNVHFVGRLLPFGIMALLLPLPWLAVLSSRRSPLPFDKGCKALALSVAGFIRVLQHGLICAVGGFLALFVLCFVHHKFQGGFACLAMAAVAVAAIGETLYVEKWVDQPSSVGPVVRIGGIKFDVLAGVASCSSAGGLLYVFFNVGNLLN